MRKQYMQIVFFTMLAVVWYFIICSSTAIAADMYTPYVISNPKEAPQVLRNNKGLQISKTIVNDDNYHQYMDIWRQMSINERGYVLAAVVENSNWVCDFYMTYPNNKDLYLHDNAYPGAVLGWDGNHGFYVDPGTYWGDWNYCDGGEGIKYNMYLYFLPASKGLTVTKTLSSDKSFVTLKMKSPDQSYVSYEYCEGFSDAQDEANSSWKDINGTTLKITKNGNYTIRAKWSGGSQGWEDFPVSQTIKVSGLKPAPLPASKSLKVTKTKFNEVKLSWQKVSNAKSYNIYQQIGSGKAKKLKNLKGTSYKFSSLKLGKKYTWFVKAVRSNGAEGKVSKSKSYTVPGVIKDLKLTRLASGKVKASWSKMAGASGYQLTITYNKKQAINEKMIEFDVSKNSVVFDATPNVKLFYYIRPYVKQGNKKLPGKWSSRKEYTLKPLKPVDTITKVSGKKFYNTKKYGNVQYTVSLENWSYNKSNHTTSITTKTTFVWLKQPNMFGKDALAVWVSDGFTLDKSSNTVEYYLYKRGTGPKLKKKIKGKICKNGSGVSIDFDPRYIYNGLTKKVAQRNPGLATDHDLKFTEEFVYAVKGEMISTWSVSSSVPKKSFAIMGTYGDQNVMFTGSPQVKISGSGVSFDVGALKVNLKKGATAYAKVLLK